MAAEEETEGLSIERIEWLIRDCRHGGPSPEEEQTPWFQACNSLVRASNRANIPLLNNLDENSNIQQIREAMADARVLIGSHPALNCIRDSPKTSHYFGALAVDAYANNFDIPHVKKFATIGLLLEEITLGTRRDVAEEIQQVLRLQDIKGTLQHLTRGSCRWCIGFAEALNIQREDEKARTERERREMMQLPPILLPNSDYMRIKKEAASYLKRGQMQESARLYKKAFTIIREAPRMDRVDCINTLSYETGRILSNLAMIYMKQNMFKEALETANESVEHFPQWSKPYCRRALALEALGRFEEADAAIYEALEKGKIELSQDPRQHQKQYDEYEAIQQRLEKVLSSKQEASSEPEPSVQSTQVIDLTSGQQSILFSIANNFNEVVQFLTPVDVARLEQTCRFFASEPERRRRVSMSAPLLHSMPREIQPFVDIYRSIAQQHSTTALRDLVSSALDKSTLIMLSRETPPKWLSRMLQCAPVAHRNAIESVCDIAGSVILRKALCYWVFKSHLPGLLNVSFDDEDVVKLVFQKDLDGEMMRLVARAKQVAGSDNVLQDMKDRALLPLANLLSAAERLREAQRQHGVDVSGRQYPLFNSIFSLHVPSRWPCVPSVEDNLDYTAEDIDNHFKSNPRELSHWKAAFTEISKWGRECKCDDTHIQLSLLAEDLPHGGIRIGSLSFGMFLMKKAVENSNSLVLKSRWDFAVLIAEYYSMLSLYKEVIPMVLQWREQRYAEHHAYMHQLATRRGVT